MDSTIIISTREKKDYYIKTWQIYVLVAALSIILSFAFQNIIMTKQVYYSLYSNQMEEYRINDMIKLTEKLQLWGYILTPLFVWLRIAFIAFLIQLPLMLKYVEIPFNEIFRIVSIAFLVLLLQNVVSFFHLLILSTDLITPESLSLIPLSLTNFLNKENYSEITIYFLSKINLFEFFWGYVVFRGLYKSRKVTKTDSLIIVMSVWLFAIALVVGLNIFIKIL